ncbi:MAG: glycosyltransferase family 2 protein [Thermoleophilaceae bacterium]
MTARRAEGAEPQGSRAGSPSAPQLAVVILSYRNEDTILAAVDSILAQDPPAELVVSHSGGGRTPDLLRRERPEVGVVWAHERRLPGGARNAGLRATSAPYAAFLAADSRAEPGWVAGRLRHHRAGAAAVGSSIVPTTRTPASIASYLLRHSWRMPHVGDPRHAPTGGWPSGLSYQREVFDAHGPFDEDMLRNEDTEFNHRLQHAGLSFSWAPEVVTQNEYPSTTGEFLRDAYGRGRLHGSTARLGPARLNLAARAALAFVRASERARRPHSHIPTGQILRALPAMLAGGLARAAGILRAGDPAGVASREFHAVLRGDAWAVRARRTTPGGASPPGRRPGRWLDLECAVRRAGWARGFLIRALARLGVRPPSAVWSGGRASTGRPRVRLIALIAARNELRFLPGCLANLAPHVDGIVALDDGSTDGTAECLAAHPKVLEVLRTPPDRAAWDEVGNYRELVHAGLRHGAEWFLVLDADERLERGFRARAERVIRRGERRGMSGFALRLCDVWDSPKHFRADGVWGRKSVPRLFRARADHEFDTRPLHGSKAPLQARRGEIWPRCDLIIYHLRMLRPEDRLARRRRYETLDPEARFQPLTGYAYLTDETGLRLRRIRRRRAWSELGAARERRPT